jgi:hypothetical protein
VPRRLVMGGPAVSRPVLGGVHMTSHTAPVVFRSSFPSVFHRLVAVTAGITNDQGEIS